MIQRMLAMLLLCVLVVGCGGDEGWTITTSGLKYRDLEVGEGTGIKIGDPVRINFKGWVANTKEYFDGNEGKEPLFVLVGFSPTIKGFQEGLIGMQKGGKRKLWIPSHLAYGQAGKPPKVQPGADLLFEMELVEVLPKGYRPEEPKVYMKMDELRDGEGPEAKRGDQVAVIYTGWLKSNNQQFDSNVGKAPFTVVIGAGGVIRGWDIGLVGMKKGSKRRLHIPAELAYGADGRPPVIPPNADLVFDVELVQIK